MVCDWVGAGIVYSKTKCDYTKPYKAPLEYYEKMKNERIFHKETQWLIEYLLGQISEYGMNKFFKCAKLMKELY